MSAIGRVRPRSRKRPFCVLSSASPTFPKFFGTERFGYDVGIKRQTELAKAYDEIQKCLRYVLDDEEEIKEKSACLINKLPDNLPVKKQFIEWEEKAWQLLP